MSKILSNLMKAMRLEEAGFTRLRKKSLHQAKNILTNAKNCKKENNEKERKANISLVLWATHSKPIFQLGLET